ncbi:MAG: PorV/PorQ family protein [Candidatus Delongbacteria bacterium]|nr:PorV/PorQ family protein [Candidatus Delongbacteria bacterium]
MKRILTIGSLWLLILSSVSVMEARDVSRATALFLRIPPSARAWGIGRAYVALADDIGSAYYNPAGLVNIKKDEMTLMYAPWLRQFVDDIHYSYFAWGKNMKDIGHLALHSTILFLGSQERTAPDGTPQGSFSSYEMALAFSYGTNLSEDLAVGGTIKYIHSHLSDQGTGQEKGTGVGKSFALDLGVLYTPDFLDRLRLGASLSNLGPDMSYIDAEQADPLPRVLKLGGAYKIINQKYNQLTFTTDLDIDMVELTGDEMRDKISTIIYCTGAEYWYGNTIGLRGGYYYDKDGDVKAPTFGASIIWQRFQFDFGYFKGESGHPLENQMIFSLLFRI